jgi:hypothetical protein
MSVASFTADEELEVFGGKCLYDVAVQLKVTVDFSETGMDWKDALREEVRKQMIEYVSEDHFGFDFDGPFSAEEEN